MPFFCQFPLQQQRVSSTASYYSFREQPVIKNHSATYMTGRKNSGTVEKTSFSDLTRLFLSFAQVGWRDRRSSQGSKHALAVRHVVWVQPRFFLHDSLSLRGLNYPPKGGGGYQEVREVNCARCFTYLRVSSSFDAAGNGHYFAPQTVTMFDGGHVFDAVVSLRRCNRYRNGVDRLFLWKAATTIHVEYFLDRVGLKLACADCLLLCGCF